MSVSPGPPLYGGLAAEFVLVAGRIATMDLTISSFSSVVYLVTFGYALAIAGMMIVTLSQVGGPLGDGLPAEGPGGTRS